MAVISISYTVVLNIISRQIVYLAWYVFANLTLLAICLASLGSKPTNITACYGDTLTFECSVNGDGSTVWKLGSAFKCTTTSEIVLLHSRYNITSTSSGGGINCSEGDVVAYAEILSNNSSNYLSQINVTATLAYTGTTFTVTCDYDNGTTAIQVSNWTVSISSSVDSLICQGFIGNISLDDQQNTTGSIFLGFGVSIAIIFIIVMSTVLLILGLFLKKKSKLHVQPAPPTDLTSSNIYSHTNNYIQQRSTSVARNQIRTSELYSHLSLNRSISIINSDYNRPECILQHNQNLVEEADNSNTNFQLQPCISPQKSESMDLDSLLLKIRDKIDMKLWYHFGLELGVPPDFLDGLRGYPHGECMIEVADYWLRSHPDKPTWSKVEDSLRKLETAQVDVNFPCSSEKASCKRPSRQTTPPPPLPTKP